MKTRRRKFIRRLIRSDGTVRAYGRTFACKEDPSRFIGDRPIFGCYWEIGTTEREVEGLSLWGHPDDDWPGRYIEDNYFKWMFWHRV